MGRATVVVLVASVACLVAAAPCAVATRTAASALDIPQSYIFTPAGKFTRLKAATSYGASKFPAQLRVTPPDRTWWGAEWKSVARTSPEALHQASAGCTWPEPPRQRHPHTELSRSWPDTRRPRLSPPPSTSTRGKGASYEEPIPVKLGGYTGEQFDGQITGGKNFDHIGHFFIPWSPRSAAKYYADEYGVYGDVFRVIVLDVQGHTVIIYIETGTTSGAVPCIPRPINEDPRLASLSDLTGHRSIDPQLGRLCPIDRGSWFDL